MPGHHLHHACPSDVSVPYGTVRHCTVGSSRLPVRELLMQKNNGAREYEVATMLVLQLNML